MYSLIYFCINRSKIFHTVGKTVTVLYLLTFLKSFFLYTVVMSVALIFVWVFLFKISSWLQIVTRNVLHISDVNLRHFVGMFLKVPTLEKFKLPINFSTSILSTSEKWKVDVTVIVLRISFTLGWFLYFLPALFTVSLWE